MKNKDLKNLIKSTALKEMPDILHKINLDSLNIIPEEDFVKQPKWNLRKIMTFSFSFLFLGVISLTAYSMFKQDPIVTNPFTTEEQFISFQAISAASMLDEIVATPLSYEITPLAIDITPLSSDTSVVIENEIDVINQYLNMMEVVLGDTTTMVSVSLESDIDEYDNYILYRNIDLIGNLIEFKLYYNYVTENENSYIRGTMYHDAKSYQIEGIIDPQTYEITSFKTSIDDGHFVNVENLSTDTQQVFRFKSYTFNALQNEGLVSLSEENNGLSAHVDTTSVQSNFHLNIQRVQLSTGSKLQVRYSLTSGNISGDGEFEVDVELDQTSGIYQYRYVMIGNGAGNEFTGGRAYKGNKQANEDDFTVTGQTTSPGHGHHGKQFNSDVLTQPDTSNVPITSSIETFNL